MAVGCEKPLARLRLFLLLLSSHCTSPLVLENESGAVPSRGPYARSVRGDRLDVLTYKTATPRPSRGKAVMTIPFVRSAERSPFRHARINSCQGVPLLYAASKIFSLSLPGQGNIFPFLLMTSLLLSVLIERGGVGGGTD